MNPEKAFANAKASLEVEGLFLTQAEEDLLRKRMSNVISEEEFLHLAIELSRRKA